MEPHFSAFRWPLYIGTFWRHWAPALSAMLLVACGDGTETCSITTNEDGLTVMSCPDGSNVVLQNGRDGKNGRDGIDGQDGRDGRDGEDGADGAPALLD